MASYAVIQEPDTPRWPRWLVPAVTAQLGRALVSLLHP